jgi:membrane fusion protein (multidrug efflux system)
MPTAFSRSLRSLEADGYRRSLWALLLVVVLLAAGAGWFFFATVAVYETTEQARLEVERAAHPVAAPVAGRVMATHLVLGANVQAGESLVELESEGERLQLGEEQARLATIRRRHDALRNQITAEEQAWPEEKRTVLLAIDEARARQREAEAAAMFAESEAERTKRLEKENLVSKADLQRAEAEAQKQRAAASAQEVTVRRLESEVKSRERNRDVRLAQLQRDAAALEGEISTIEATVKRNEFVIEQRRIRAPISGELGEIAELQTGGFVSEGQKIGVIIPAGQLKLVAQFSPWTAAGRLRPGQPARLRLASFPWAQYGSVGATVVGVANEPRDGQLRVELSVKADSARTIPLQHGLAGTVEVAVERVSPAVLVLRAAGKLLRMPTGVNHQSSIINRQ